MTATASRPAGDLQGAVHPERLEPVLEAVRRRAAGVDAALDDPRRVLAEVASAGLLDQGVDDLLAGSPAAADVRATADVVAQLARECLSSGFVVWAHRMVIDYLARGRRTDSSDRLLRELRRGERVGVTAMATGMKALAGLEPLSVTGRAAPDGTLELSGRLHWASNLVPGAVIVLPAQLDDGRRVVVRIGRDDDGVIVHPVTGLLALDATASGSLSLTGVRVGADAVLSEDFAGFAAGFRPAFLLIQSALAVGLAGRSLDEARAGLDRPGNDTLAPSLAELARRFEAVRGAWWRMAADAPAAPLRDLLQVRLDAALLVGEATRLELTVAGGRGDHAPGGPARRFREAAFFPVQSPSEGHLRWELSSLN